MKIEILIQKHIYNRIKSIQENKDYQLFFFLVPLCCTKLIEEDSSYQKCVLLDYSVGNSQYKNSSKQQFVKLMTEYGRLYEEQLQQQQKKTLKSLGVLIIKTSIQIVQQIINSQQISNSQQNQFKHSSKQTINIKQVENIQQINAMLKNIVFLSIKLPKQISLLSKQSLIALNGYMFNSKQGKNTHGFSNVHKGKLTSLDAIGNIQQSFSFQKSNKVYSKSQLSHIVQQIKLINENKLNQQQNISQTQNFYHGEKYTKNSLNVLNPFYLDIELMISLSNSEKNRIQNVSLQQFNESTNSQNAYENIIILNTTYKTEKLTQQILLKVREIIQSHNNKNDLYVPLKRQIESGFLFRQSYLPLKLSNPHAFLKTDQKDGFNQYYVKGIYQYFHYGDQSFNDQGWGCAYRSLQTLISWFQLQKFLNIISVPTITDIQNIIDLIDFSSKTKLSNSSNWIGATEVSWVIKKLTNFDCRILHINDGKDIVEHAQSFRNHLQKVGTPIMYGGDQYAYTIVGINYNWKLGQIMFCILDPHYNGNDKIQKIIQKKGICWRKPQQMFKKGVFYNFCMPIL